MTVGAKDFAEQDILGEILVQHLGLSALAVGSRLHLGGSLVAQEALLRGDIDLYPEYSGTALASVLKLPLAKDKEAVFAAVKAAYAQRHQVEWGWRLGFENTFALVTTAKRAQQLQVKTLSEAARGTAKWRLGVGYEFEQRPDGWAAFSKVYPLPLEGRLRTMDLGLLYRALDAGDVDVVAGNSTDAALARPELVVLEDDQHFFPPYECCLAVREQALREYPALRPALDKLAGKIDTAAMRRMNRELVEERKNPREIAYRFLRP